MGWRRGRSSTCNRHTSMKLGTPTTWGPVFLVPVRGSDPSVCVCESWASRQRRGSTSIRCAESSSCVSRVPATRPKSRKRSVDSRRGWRAELRGSAGAAAGLAPSGEKPNACLASSPGGEKPHAQPTRPGWPSRPHPNLERHRAPGPLQPTGSGTANPCAAEPAPCSASIGSCVSPKYPSAYAPR